jgi:hypothetical protein
MLVTALALKLGAVRMYAPLNCCELMVAHTGVGATEAVNVGVLDGTKVCVGSGVLLAGMDVDVAVAVCVGVEVALGCRVGRATCV